MKCKLRFTVILRIFIILIFSAASCGFFLWFAYSGNLTSFLDWLASLGYWGNFIFIIALAATGLPFALGGYTPLGLAAGFLYGVWPATVTVTIGTFLGSSLGFWTTRKLMKAWFRALVDSRPVLQAFMKTMESHGFKLVLIMRMAPIPFGVQNGLFSIADISFTSFSVASFLGLMPEIIMLVYMGTTMRDLAEIASGDLNFGPMQQAMLGIEIGVSVILAIILVWLSRSAMNQVRKNQENAALQLEDGSGVGLLSDHHGDDEMMTMTEDFSIQGGSERGGGDGMGSEESVGDGSKRKKMAGKKKSEINNKDGENGMGSDGMDTTTTTTTTTGRLVKKKGDRVKNKTGIDF